jgi:hypothetical protein
MDEPTRRDAIQRYVEATDRDIAHEIFHDDAILEFPQSQERFEGKTNIIAWRKIYPAEVGFKIRRIHGQGKVWVVELSVQYDGGAWNYGCSILEFQGDKVVRETIYFGEGWEAPEWRAPWRAAWQDELVG